MYSSINKLSYWSTQRRLAAHKKEPSGIWTQLNPFSNAPHWTLCKNLFIELQSSESSVVFLLLILMFIISLLASSHKDKCISNGKFFVVIIFETSIFMTDWHWMAFLQGDRGPGGLKICDLNCCWFAQFNVNFTLESFAWIMLWFVLIFPLE